MLVVCISPTVQKQNPRLSFMNLGFSEDAQVMDGFEYIVDVTLKPPSVFEAIT